MTHEVDIRPQGEVIRAGYYGTSGDFGTLETTSHRGLFTPAFSKLGVSFGVPSELWNNSLIKARNKVKSQDVNLAQAFGEHAQTAGLVADSLERVAKMYRAFRQGNLIELRRYFQYGSVRRMRKDFLRSWLEFQYGVKPLLSDIHGAVTALDQKSHDQYMVTVKAKSSVNQSGEVDWATNTNTAVQGHYRLKVQATHGVYTRIDVCPDNHALMTAASLGFTNPAQLAWEFLLFSFVVDWAYPLGSYFSQLDALVGWEVKGFSQSAFTRIRSEATGQNFVDSDGYPVQQRWTGKYSLTKLDRLSGTSVPFATLPSFKNPISTTHLMNALALLTESVRLH
jgi:hypothetical protein